MPRAIQLHAEIEDLNGRIFRWDADAPDPRDRPQGLYFRTQRGDGFADASCTLNRRIDQDYADLGLFNTLRLISLAGEIVYEGRITGFPRASDPTSQTFQVNAAGWMSHANDRTFQEIYVDRDLSAWTQPSVQRRANLIGAGLATKGETGTAEEDVTTGQAALRQSLLGAWSASNQVEAWYYGGGVVLASLYYAWKRGNPASMGAGGSEWSWSGVLSTDDLTTASDSSGDLEAAGPGTGTVTASASNRLFAALILLISTAGGAEGVEYPIFWTCLAVYGNHGLTKRGTASATTAQGFYASDLVTNIVSRFCPKLDVSGGTIDATTYVVQQSAYKTPTLPYAALQDVNKFHQYELSVWEGRKFYFTQPTPLTEYDWEVRTDDPGVKLNLQGDSIEDVANGIVVIYTDLITGKQQTLTPETNTSLADTSVTNPANLAGIQKWTTVTVPFATLAADALQIGIAELAEASRPKSPGTIDVGTQIRDRNGNWQPAWRVRCGQRIAITNHPNDAPRRVIDTRWNDTPFQQGLQITVDNKSNRMDALFDRILSGRAAAGIS